MDDRCERCGATLSAEQAFCTTCGTARTASVTDTPMPPPPESPGYAAPSSPPPGAPPTGPPPGFAGPPPSFGATPTTHPDAPRPPGYGPPGSTADSGPPPPPAYNPPPGYGPPPAPGAPPSYPQPGYGVGGWAPPPTMPPKKSHRGLIILAVVLVLVVIIGIAGLALLGSTLDDRESVESDQGIEWTMVAEPREQNIQLPAEAGTTIDTDLYIASATDEPTEGVYIYDVTGRTFDPDLGLEGMAMEMGGTVSNVRDATVDGKDARMGDIDLTVGGEPRYGQAVVLHDGNVVLAAIVYDLSGDFTKSQISDQLEVLTDSIQFD